MFDRLRDLRTVRSWYGWPVPAVIRVVTAAQLRDLIDIAVANGFSRRARDVPVEPEREYLLVPELGAESPIWICRVVAVPAGGALVAPGEKLWYTLLDVPVADFRRLPRLGRRRRDELLHWMAHAAYERRRRA
ncbi:hypothetical protein ACGFIY_02870 [Micromonospora chersina]|uniref:hypothetical protein n=1 Tax=Micromonospora chersina TaxID=47854 RepID=UPI00371B709D